MPYLKPHSEYTSAYVKPHTDMFHTVWYKPEVIKNTPYHSQPQPVKPASLEKTTYSK